MTRLRENDPCPTCGEPLKFDDEIWLRGDQGPDDERLGECHVVCDPCGFAWPANEEEDDD